MKPKMAHLVFLAVVIICIVPMRVSCEEIPAIQLLKPPIEIGKPLMQALKEKNLAGVQQQRTSSSSVL